MSAQNPSSVPVPYLVCSRNMQETETWRRSRGIGPRDVIHAGSFRSLCGVGGEFAVVRLPGFADNPYADKIELTISRMERKRRP
jgi:hypothetical protein